MIVSIHQPNYIPWLGYFHKIHQSDVHVFLDDVEYSKNNFINRNKILMNGVEVFLTIPVPRKHHSSNINEIFIEENKWRAKHIKTLKQAYSKSEYFSLYIDEIEDIILNSGAALSNINSSIIKWMCDKFGIETKFVYSSDIEKPQELKKTDLLLGILNALSADTYISGLGANNYLDVFKFAEIKLIWQNFEYPAKKVSALDLLFNEGPKSGNFLN